MLDEILIALLFILDSKFSGCICDADGVTLILS